jgi:hypothetical protein
MTETTALSHADDALAALADVSVALLSLYPLARLGAPAQALGFAEDAIAAAARARRHLLDLRAELDAGADLHSVRVEP